MSESWTVEIDRGRGFVETLAWTVNGVIPDLTGFTGQILLAEDSSGILTLSAPLVVNVPAGEVTVTLTPAQTALLTARAYLAEVVLYDALLVPTTLVAGIAFIRDPLG